MVALPAPATARELATAEAHLAFPVPRVVRRIYTGHGQRRFGSGYGLVGIGGGRAGFHRGARTWHCEDEYTNLRSDPQIRWRPQVLPVIPVGSPLAGQRARLRLDGQVMYVIT